MGPKTLLAHDAHLVVDIGQDFGRQIGRTLAVVLDLHADMGDGSLAQRLRFLLAHGVRKTRLRHRPHRRGLVQRVADDIVLRLGDEALDEFVNRPFRGRRCARCRSSTGRNW